LYRFSKENIKIEIIYLVSVLLYIIFYHDILFHTYAVLAGLYGDKFCNPYVAIFIDDDDVYLNKLQTKGVKIYPLHVKRRPANKA
jgi:hypothetical protein